MSIDRKTGLSKNINVAPLSRREFLTVGAVVTLSAVAAACEVENTLSTPEAELSKWSGQKVSHIQYEIDGAEARAVIISDFLIAGEPRILMRSDDPSKKLLLGSGEKKFMTAITQSDYKNDTNGQTYQRDEYFFIQVDNGGLAVNSWRMDDTNILPDVNSDGIAVMNVGLVDLKGSHSASITLPSINDANPRSVGILEVNENGRATTFDLTYPLDMKDEDVKKNNDQWFGQQLNSVKKILENAEIVVAHAAGLSEEELAEQTKTAEEEVEVPTQEPTAAEASPKVPEIITIAKENIKGRFPEILRTGINKVQELKDADGGVYAREAYSGDLLLLVDDNNSGEWIIAPYGTGLPPDENGDPSVNYQKWFPDEETGKKKWTRISTVRPETNPKGVDAQEEEIAKLVEFAAKQENSNSAGSPELRSYSDLCYLDVNPDYKDAAYDQFLNAYINSKQLKVEKHWQNHGIGPFTDVGEAKEFLQNSQGGPENRTWWMPDFRYLTGAPHEGDLKKMVEAPGAYLDDIKVFTFSLKDVENPMIRAFVNRRITNEGLNYWGTPSSANMRPDISGFKVDKSGDLFWVMGLLEDKSIKTFHPDWIGKQVFDGSENDARIASAWYSLSIKVIENVDMVGADPANKILSANGIVSCISAICGAMNPRRPLVVDVDKIDDPIFIKK